MPKHLAIVTLFCFLANATHFSAEFCSAEEPISIRKADDKPVVILNMAADALVDYLRMPKALDKATPEMIVDGLHEMVDQYESTNVTHLFFNIGYQRTGYRTRVWESYWDDEDPESNLKGWPRKYWLIHKRQVDPFAVCISRSRQKGIAPWVSIRMNDTHHLKEPALASRLWWQNPQFRLREHAGFDFSHGKVRQHYLALVEELVQRYDVDGVELDLMRYADFFQPKEARLKCNVLTEFMFKVRRITEAAAEKRGHPVKVSVRVPARPDFAVGFGLDVVAWVRKGLIDILVPCSTWNPSYPDIPIEKWRSEVGETNHAYLIIPGTDLWISGAQSRPFIRSNMETMRGFSASMLDRGADAIYLFNHFERTDSKIWQVGKDGERVSKATLGNLLQEAGKLEPSVKSTRRHVLVNHDPVPPGSKYRRPLPTTITSKEAMPFKIHLGPQPNSDAIKLRVGLKDTPGYQDAKIEAKVNGVDCGVFLEIPKSKVGQPSDEVWEPTLAVGDLAPRMIQFSVPKAAVRRGYNEVTLRTVTPRDQTVVWLEVLIPGSDSRK